MSTEQMPIRSESGYRVVRLIRPSVVVLCGPAACGKSTFAERHFRPTQIISSDRARALVCDDERDQRYHTQAFALLHCLIEQRLSINRLCIVDSTALTPQARRSLLDLARRYQVPCVVLLLDVPLGTCLERDAGRERTVGRPAIERQYQLFEQAKAAIKQEGFDQVIELRGEELERVQIEIMFRPVPRPTVSPVGTEPDLARRAVRSRQGTPSRQGASWNQRSAWRFRGPLPSAQAGKVESRVHTTPPARDVPSPTLSDQQAAPAEPSGEPESASGSPAGPAEPAGET